MLDAPLPHGIEAEREVIGTALSNAEYLGSISLEPEDFYLLPHQEIYRAVVALHQAGHAVSPQTVAEMLTRKNKLQEAGGEAALLLLSLSGSILTLETNAAIVKDYALRRRAIYAALELANQARDLTRPLEKSQEGLISALMNNVNPRGAVPVSEWMREALSRFEEAGASPELGILSGFVDLDEITQGFRPGVCIITGKPGLGKSIFLENLAAYASRRYPGVYYSLEMSADDMAHRMISAESGVRISRMISGEADDEEYTKVIRAGGDISTKPLYVSDTPITVAGIRADLYRLKQAHGIKWAAVDYLELISGDYRGMKEYERAGMISRQLTQVAKELAIPLFLVQRFNKTGFQGQAPDMESLAGSAEISYHAAYILAMMEHIPEAGYPKDPNVRTILILKGRYLEASRRWVSLYKDPYLPRFRNLEARQVAPTRYNLLEREE